MYCVKMEEENPLGIDPDIYWFAISGWMPVCCNKFVDSNDVGIVVKTSGTHPDARVEVKPRQQDLGRYGKDDPTRQGRQPHLVQFPIKHANYWHGVQELCGMIRYVWQCGQTVVFLDNDGGYRATTAAAVVLAAMQGVDSFQWLPTLMYYREVPALFQDFYHYRVDKPDPNWFPRDYQHYVYWCRMAGLEAKMTEHNRLLGLALTPPGTPRGLSFYRERRDRGEAERAAFYTPVHGDVDPLVAADGYITEQADPAPDAVPPQRGTGEVVNLPVESYSHTPPPSPRPPPAGPGPFTPPLPSPRHSPRGGPGPSTPPLHSPRNSPRSMPRLMWSTYDAAAYPTSQHIDHDPDAVFRVRGTGVPTCFGGTSGSLHSDDPCRIDTAKPQRLACFGNTPQVDNLIGVSAPAAPDGWTRRPAAAAVVDTAQQMMDDNVDAPPALPPAKRVVSPPPVVRIAVPVPRPPPRDVATSSTDQMIDDEMSFQDDGCWGAGVPEPEPRGGGARTRASSIRRWRKKKPHAPNFFLHEPEADNGVTPTLHEPEADNGVTSEPDDGIALGGEAPTLRCAPAPGLVEPSRWDANPGIVEIISGADLSDKMRQFLDYCHLDDPNNRDATNK